MASTTYDDTSTSIAYAGNWTTRDDTDPAAWYDGEPINPEPGLLDGPKQVFLRLRDDRVHGWCGWTRVFVARFAGRDSSFRRYVSFPPPPVFSSCSWGVGWLTCFSSSPLLFWIQKDPFTTPPPERWVHVPEVQQADDVGSEWGSARVPSSLAASGLANPGSFRER